MRPPLSPPDLCTWSLSDGYALRGRIWQPHNSPPRLTVLYLHGIQSHGGWFEWSASLLAEAGCAVVLADRRGSGLNQEARGDTPSADRWLADIDELADWAASTFAAARFGVVGVSWGGKLAAAWALRRPERVERLMLIAPGLFPAVDLGLWDKLRVVQSLLAGGRRQMDVPLADPALFTDNPAGRQFIADDPLKLPRVTARFLYFSRVLDRELRRAAVRSLASPITLLLAGRDRIIRNGPTESWTRRISAQSVDIQVLNGCAHTLEFEPEVAPFAENLRRWAGLE